ncbi:MAG: hypothetical protein HBSAPP02_27530 [Phycisphaerae bacterium]|nr:MAG: hypothetical protein HBSAPP02_27530 [Phycisphaerae bacterium]
MRERIRSLVKNADRAAAARWLRQTVRTIGPGFHFDTAPGEYVDETATPTFRPAEAQRLVRDLKRASALLGRSAFEDLCLQAVWRGLGLRYDPALARLVSLGR